jgi:hypothetical protein
MMGQLASKRDREERQTYCVADQRITAQQGMSGAAVRKNCRKRTGGAEMQDCSRCQQDTANWCKQQDLYPSVELRCKSTALCRAAMSSNPKGMQLISTLAESSIQQQILFCWQHTLVPKGAQYCYR